MVGLAGKVVEESTCSNGTEITIDISYDRYTSHSGPYCCYECRNKRVSIERKDVSVNQSGTITYYKHSIKDQIDKLAKIKYCRKDGQTREAKFNQSLLPLNGPVDVYAFHCNENPVLIYVEKNEPETINKWFQIDTPDNGQWSQVRDKLDGVTPNVGTDCDKFKRLTAVLNLLQCLEKDCTPTSSYSSSGNHGLQVASGVEGSGTSQDVIIKLDNKPSDGGSTQYPGYDINTVSTGKTIKVKKRDGPGSEFIKYVHSEQNDSPFKLLKVIDGNILVCQPSQLGDVTSVLAYYWKHKARNNDKALLVEVISNSGSKHPYYANSSSGWSEYIPSEYKSGNTLSEDQLKHKLTLLNCEINDVVQIDVQQTGDYCHTPKDTVDTHTPNKITVSPVDGAQLTNYKAYEHKPKNNSGKFHISAFKNGMNEITLNGLFPELPVMDASKVIVFMCQNGGDKTPLLIYIDASTLNKKWFQSDDKGDTWEKVDSGVPQNPTSYTEILEILDKLTSDCKPPEVTIKINERDPSSQTHSYQDPPRTINVEKNDHQEDVLTDFTEYTHKVVGRQNSYFTLKQVNYGDGGKITAIASPTPKVSSVSVFYWTALETNTWKERSNPLLIKVLVNGDVKWYENEGTNKENTTWSDITAQQKSKLADYKKLKSKLILLNCKLNNVTTIDIGKKPADQPPTIYCHKEGSYDYRKLDETHEELIQVIEDLSYKNKLGNFVVYQHDLTSEATSKPLPLDKKFHISGFVKGDGKPIQLTGKPSPPFLYVSEVLVFWCSSEPNGSPLLVHFKHSSTPSETEKGEWYKKDGETDWKEVSGIEIPKSETDTDSIYEILNGYKTKCKSWVKEIVITTVSVAGGSGVIGGVSYATYWYFFLRDPWWRLM